MNKTTNDRYQKSTQLDQLQQYGVALRTVSNRVIYYTEQLSLDRLFNVDEEDVSVYLTTIMGIARSAMQLIDRPKLRGPISNAILKLFAIVGDAVLVIHQFLDALLANQYRVIDAEPKSDDDLSIQGALEAQLCHWRGSIGGFTYKTHTALSSVNCYNDLVDDLCYLFSRVHETMSVAITAKSPLPLIAPITVGMMMFMVDHVGWQADSDEQELIRSHVSRGFMQRYIDWDGLNVPTTDDLIKTALHRIELNAFSEEVGDEEVPF